jgi:DnaJ-class molecular chaperone
LCDAPGVVELAQVLLPKDLPRGADVQWRVDVLRGTLQKGVQLELEMPRRLPCAKCEGGGCDRCERSGAIVLRQATEPAEQLSVLLSEAQHGMVRLRIPQRGGPGSADEVRGDLELILCEAEVNSSCVLSRVQDPRPVTVWLWWFGVLALFVVVYLAYCSI